MRGRWWPAGDPAPLNRELRAAPGDIPSEGARGTRERTRVSGPFQMASQGTPRSRCPEAAGVGGMTFGWEGAAPGPKGSPLPHPWPGSLYLRSRDGFTVRSHHPDSDSAAGCQTQRAGPQRRPGSHPRTPPTLVPPRPEPGLPRPPRPVGPSAGGEDPPRGASDLLEEDAPWDRGPNPHGKSF